MIGAAIITAVFIACIVFLIPGKGCQDEMTTIPVKFIDAYDGDSITMDVPGWPPKEWPEGCVDRYMKIRVFGIDAKEMKSRIRREKRKAIEAKYLVNQMLGNAKEVKIRIVSQGKYFRLVAHVYADGESIGETLIGRGLAVPYAGDTKGRWEK